MLAYGAADVVYVVFVTRIGMTVTLSEFGGLRSKTVHLAVGAVLRFIYIFKNLVFEDIRTVLYRLGQTVFGVWSRPVSVTAVLRFFQNLLFSLFIHIQQIQARSAPYAFVAWFDKHVNRT